MDHENDESYEGMVGAGHGAILQYLNSVRSESSEKRRIE